MASQGHAKSGEDSCLIASNYSDERQESHCMNQHSEVVMA